ncbi:MAG: MFS transporter [Verrucomicrobia bacterium]|nr:MFS transporter [Verrucomicrobiota bacterium]
MWFSAKSQVVGLPLECKKLIFLNSLFQGGRLFVGAVCVFYFLSFGLQTEEYAWVKTTQAIIFIGLDIPLGYFLNKTGEYKSLLLALAFGIIGAFGYLISQSFIGFLISEIFLALSLSTWPVALSAYSMRILENYKIDGLVERFFHFGDAISNVIILICGSLGGLLYASNRHIPYGCFLIFYIFAALVAFFFLKEFDPTNKIEKKIKINIFNTNIKELMDVFPFASMLFLSQFFMQPLFHYWQPLFGEKFAVNPAEMSVVFIGYSLAMSTVSLGYSRVTHLSIFRSNLFIVGSALIGSLVYSLIARFDSFSSSLIFFAVSFGIFNLVQVAGGVFIQNRLKKESRMIVTKYVSFYARMGMIASLVVLHYFFANEWATTEVYKLYGGLAVVAFCLYFVWMLMRKKVERRYVIELKN